jgi:hypothetical protein
MDEIRGRRDGSLTMLPCGRWDSLDWHVDMQYHRLPVDLTPGGVEGREVCWRSWRTTSGRWGSWLCTRPAGHTGRHAAGDGVRIRAVW